MVSNIDSFFAVLSSFGIFHGLTQFLELSEVHQRIVVVVNFKIQVKVSFDAHVEN